MMRYAKYGVFLLAAIWILTGCAQRVLVQPVVDMERYNRLAVLPFESDSFFTTVGNQLADEILVKLIQSAPKLDMVERTRIEALMQEQNLSRSNYVSPETAIAVGKLLGVKAILTGSVSVSIGDIQPTPANAQRIASGTVTARLIDTETGKIIWGGRKQSEYSAYVGSTYGQTSLNVRTDQEMVQYVITKLAEQIAQAFYTHYELQY